MRLIAAGRPLRLDEIDTPACGPGDVLVRVRAAGICHSDVHYRAGTSPAGPLPLTLGHEVAGVVEQVGDAIEDFAPGTRVCLHYLAVCGECDWCRRGREQFCPRAQMLGKHRDGGFAEFVLMPASSVIRLPNVIAFEHAAVMMCSSATALHALRKARMQAGDSVAVFGVGGLGASAIQLARSLGASRVIAIDINPRKLEFAQRAGAIAIDASAGDPVAAVRDHTGGRGVDVALELIGLPLTMKQAVQSLAIGGRAALAGITDRSFDVAPYAELINKEAEIIGVSDHLKSEIPELLDWAAAGKLDLAAAITRTVPLDADAVNDTLDRLADFGDDVRVVIVPN